MSGIAGLVDVTGRPVDMAELREMMQPMEYRGPDGCGEWFGGTVALGQCNFHTTLEAQQATMPLRSENGHVIVMDGRVDNWEELREAVLQKGARLRDCSDATLVLEAYRIWGEGCVEHIDGDFALAIWDPETQQLFSARDRVGFKPFSIIGMGRVSTSPPISPPC
jgi:asparagine synthase (glutamine-hydrolysing)